MHPFYGYPSTYNAPQQVPYSPMPNTIASTPTPPHPNSHYAAAYSSHYARAYQAQYYPPTSAAPGATGLHPHGSLASVGRPIFQPPPNSSSWYSPGACRCTHPNCNFVGSAKSLEIHLMDRHLIYPQGWKERKRKPDWDADPSLKGKPVPVQGTGVILDTPEKIEDWVAERKKRWPTKDRTEDKQQKHDEALARGQLDLSEPARKRRRVEEYDGPSATRGRGRGMGRGRGQPAGRGRGAAMARTAPMHGPSGIASLPAKPTAAVIEAADAAPTPASARLPVQDDADSSSDSDDDGAPLEVATTKSATPLESFSYNSDEPPSVVVVSSASMPVPSGSRAGADTVPLVPAPERKIPLVLPPQPPKRHQPQAPKRAPPNPFAPKRSLLRSLLLPEIRMTASNLSQAIRFLVDNDFLEEVELRPGEADERMIEVISETINPNI